MPEVPGDNEGKGFFALEGLLHSYTSLYYESSTSFQVCIGGLDRSFGLLFRRLMDAFPDASLVSIASLLPVITSLKMLVSPLTTMLCERTGYRVVCAGGGFCFALGIILASQASSLSLFYASIIVSGLGVGFIYCPALCLVLKYFDKRRSVRNQILQTLQEFPYSKVQHPILPFSQSSIHLLSSDCQRIGHDRPVLSYPYLDGVFHRVLRL